MIIKRTRDQINPIFLQSLRNQIEKAFKLNHQASYLNDDQINPQLKLMYKIDKILESNEIPFKKYYKILNCLHSYQYQIDSTEEIEKLIVENLRSQLEANLELTVNSEVDVKKALAILKQESDYVSKEQQKSSEDFSNKWQVGGEPEDYPSWKRLLHDFEYNMKNENYSRIIYDIEHEKSEIKSGKNILKLFIEYLEKYAHTSEDYEVTHIADKIKSSVLKYLLNENEDFKFYRRSVERIIDANRKGKIKYQNSERKPLLSSSSSSFYGQSMSHTTSFNDDKKDKEDDILTTSVAPNCSR